MSKFLKVLPFIFVVGCAGVSRDCSSMWNSTAGADWIVVQYEMAGNPFNCWRLPGVSLSSETGSDGIYWKAPDGHMVHVGGWYNHIQVSRGDWASAAKTAGVDLNRCTEGKYAAE